MKEDKNDENYIYYIIGQNLKKLRKDKGFTQERLAEESHYALSFIGNLESDKVFQTISVGSLYHLAKILGIDIRELFAPHRRKQVKMCIHLFLLPKIAHFCLLFK